MHLTETCEENAPHLITHVATTPAPITDELMTEAIHQDLEQAKLLPSQHLLDSGYITAPILAGSQQRFGIEVLGSPRKDVKWQANTGQGIDASQFHIDWDHKQAICPEGHTSRSWTPAKDLRNNEVIKIRFSTKDCQRCPRLASCTHTTSRTPRRRVSVRPQAQYQALQAARRRQQTPTFVKQYALRAGVEATISEARACLRYARLRESRVTRNERCAPCC